MERIKHEDGNGQTHAGVLARSLVNSLLVIYIYLGNIEIREGRRQRRSGACAACLPMLRKLRIASQASQAPELFVNVEPVGTTLTHKDGEWNKLGDD